MKERKAKGGGARVRAGETKETRGRGESGKGRESEVSSKWLGPFGPPDPVVGLSGHVDSASESLGSPLGFLSWSQVRVCL